MKTLDEIRAEAVTPAVIADHNGFITYVNGGFRAVFGWEPADIVGKSITVLMPASYHQSHQLGFSRFLTTGVATLLNQPLTLQAVTKDGREFPAEHTITAEERDGRWVFGALIRPL